MLAIQDYLANASAIKQDASFCSLDGKTRSLLQAAAAEILKRPDLLADLEQIDHALEGDRLAWNAAPWRRFPTNDSTAGAFLLVFPILHHLAPIRAFYAERKIPERYLQALMSDLQRWIATHRQRTMGRAGFREINWLREHVRAKIFEIGRLQFQPGKWSIPVVPLENMETGDRVLLAQSKNDSITMDGGYSSAVGANARNSVPLVYEESPNGFTGHRILEDGCVRRSPESFPASLWRRAVSVGAPIINIHIPCGAPLSPDACRTSIEEALEFFPTYFPDWPVAKAKAMVCQSWLLYPDFQKLLATTSNIVGFQKLFHLFPIPETDDAQFFERAFVPWGRKVSRDQLSTSLQFALFDHIQAGHTPLETGGILFTDDFKN